MVSGGADSMALLALVHDIVKSTPSNVVIHHCNHGVQSNAEVWCEFVQSRSKQYGFTFQCHDLKLEQDSNFEAYARKARYEAVLDYVQSGDIVMTAHHLDDQVETIIIRLSQGSGLMGLRGIPIVRKFGTGELVRPLLKLTRLQLRQFLLARKLSFVVDASNDDLAILRNFARKKFLPALTKVSPNARQRFLDLSQIATTQIFNRVKRLGDRMPNRDISVVKLADTEQMIDWQIRFFAESRGQFAPSRKQIKEFARQCLKCPIDRVPELSLRAPAVIRRWGECLYWIDNPEQLGFHKSIEVHTVHLARNSSKTLDLKYGRLILKTANAPANLHIWEGVTAQSFRFGPNRPRQSLKQIAQTIGVAPWLRKTTPLISQEEIILGWGGIDCRKPSCKLNSLKWEWQFVPLQKQDISVC